MAALRKLSLILSLVLAVVWLVPAHAEPSIQQQRSRLQQIQQRLDEVRAKAKQLKVKESKAVSHLTVLQQKLERTQIQLEDSQFRLQRSQNRLSETRKALDQAKRKFERQQTTAGSRLRAIYKHRQTNLWEALLTAPDLVSFLTRYQFFKHVTKQDAQILSELDRQMAEITHQKRKFDEQVQTIASITATISSQKREVQEDTQEQSTLVSRLRSERAEYEQAAEQLERDSRQIETMIRRMLANRKKTPRMGSGRFLMPVEGRLSSNYGPRRHPIHGVVKEHRGVDFGAPHGTPIRAAEAGVVLYVGWYGGYGKIVMIDHGGDLVTLYAHTSRYVVDTGEKVARGQVIAHIGSTGLSTGPHLHFEVRRNGTPVNPISYLQ
jgi:murein DD-endopeptidase MepM/ murein hydrolase activator NlpD